MMHIPIDIHWMPSHQGQEDDGAAGAFAAIQPGAIWIVNPDRERVRRAHAAVPSATIYLRDHPQSEQKDFMARDPVGCAEQHIRDWSQHIPQWAPDIARDHLGVTGINEPDLDPNHPGAIEAALRYNVRLVERGTQERIAVAALSASVGWIHNTGPDMPADWPTYRVLLEAIRAGRRQGVPHVLNLHEYWGRNGPAGGWGWYAGRFLWALEWMRAWGWDPEDCPLRFGEFGMDVYATDPSVPEPERRGWRENVPAERYVRDVEWYLSQLCYHPSVLGAAGFTWDIQSTEWNSFDWRPIAPLWVDLVGRLRAQSDPRIPAAGLPLGAHPVVPPVVAAEPLPADETAVTTPELARKVRWWTEETVRMFEARRPERAEAIVRSNVVLSSRLVAALEPAPAPKTGPAKPAVRDVVDVLPRSGQYDRRALADVDQVVVHHSVADADAAPTAIARYHVNKGWPGIGYHYYIPADGTIYECQRLESVSWHAGSHNGHTVGVCLGGDFTSAVPTDAQLAAAARLIAWLCGELHIEASAVVGHRDLAGQQTQCPGNQWNAGHRYRSALLARIGALLG